MIFFVNPDVFVNVAQVGVQIDNCLSHCAGAL